MKITSKFIVAILLLATAVFATFLWKPVCDEYS